MPSVGDEPEEGGGDVVVEPVPGVVVGVLEHLLDVLRRSGEGAAGDGDRAAEGRRRWRRRRGGGAAEAV